MLKIAVSSETTQKFCADLIQHWKDSGHEVRYESGGAEYLAQWADVYYVEWATNNIRYLYKHYHDSLEVTHGPEFDINKKPLFICRIFDWDVWIGWARDQALIDWVDKWVCIAPHIESKLRKEADYGDKLSLIRPGINTEKFGLKTKETDGFQLGMVLGDMWTYKNHMAGLDIFTSLSHLDDRWRLHVRGQHEPGEYNPVMFEHYLESRGIRDKVTLYPPQDDMNAWYENIDHLLHPGMKEAFSYAVGEAMSKGIHVVCNEFFGSRDIWPNYILYQTHDEAVKKLMVYAYKQFPQVNREYIVNNYSNEKMFTEFDKLLSP